jgi:hypothetical protein
MKIIKVMSKRIEDKEYSKYLLNLPKNIVEESNLLGKELKAKTENEKIIIEKDLKEHKNKKS